MKEYDAIIIGSGAGTKLVRPVADLGFKVALIEKERLGGTCLNRGCIPSKMLIHAADIAEKMGEASRFDIHWNEEFEVDLEKLVSRVNHTTDKESDNIEPLMQKHPNVDYYHEKTRFVSDKVLQIGQEQITVNKKGKIFIAVGSEPFVPNIEGLKDTPFMTYREAIRNRKKPERLIVIGGGYIATELGHFYSALGVDTHFFVRGDFLARSDHEIKEEFTRSFCKHHQVHWQASPKKVSYKNGMFTMIYETPKGQELEFEADQLFLATGVRPATQDLGLEHTSIKSNKGFIVVDDHLETNVPGIFALGDCNGRYAFRHSANFEGEYLFEAHFKAPHKNPISYPPMPHAVFTSPQLAGCGPTEEELKEQGVDYIVGRCRYENSAMGMALLSKYGLVKLIFERQSQKLIAAHIIGEEASNMIHMPIAYMNMGATLQDLLRTIYVHPALPELIRNAARDANKQL